MLRMALLFFFHPHLQVSQKPEKKEIIFFAEKTQIIALFIPFLFLEFLYLHVYFILHHEREK